MNKPPIKLFEMTTEGCRQATEYLKSIDKYNDFLDCTFSTDGYTLVATANCWLEQHKKANKGETYEKV